MAFTETVTVSARSKPMSDKKIVSIDDAQKIRQNRIVETNLQIVNKCQACFFDQLPKLIRALFEHADDDMYELANKARYDIVETQYFSAMRELRKLQENIESSFQDYLMTNFKEFWIAHNVMSDHNANPQLDDLSLVEDDELEEQLAVDGLISKADNHFILEIQGISARFALLAGMNELDVKQNPLSPYHFVNAFRIALRQWDGDIGLRLLVLKIFDLQVVNYIGGIYDSINDILIENGILPELKQKIKRNPITPAIERAMEGTPSPTAASVPIADEFSVSSVAVTDTMVRMIDWLVMSQGYAPYSQFLPAVNSADQTTSASDVDVLEALTGLQKMLLKEPLVAAEEIRQKNIEHIGHLASLLRRGDGQAAEKNLSEQDRLIIDAVGVLFDLIVNDPSLPESSKALVSRLQFPLIKSAKIDFSFFGNRVHPGRRLLNAIVQAMMGWSDDGSRSEQSVYGQVEAAICFVLENFDDDARVFEIASERIETFLVKRNLRAAKAEERVTQVMRGQEELLSARQRVAEVMHRMNLRAKNLPEVVLDFEREAWHDVLMLAILRDGEGSERWTRHLSTLKVLIWSVTPKAGLENRQKLLKVIPSLLKKLQAGLRDIGYEMSKASSLFDRLQQCHSEVLSGKHNSQNERLLATDSLTCESHNLHHPQDTRKVAADIPDVGTWLKWKTDGVIFRGKLAWHSTLNGTCIFVNHNGMKLAEISDARLADLLENNDAEVLIGTKGSFMEGILESMQSVLKGEKKLSLKC